METWLHKCNKIHFFLDNENFSKSESQFGSSQKFKYWHHTGKNISSQFTWVLPYVKKPTLFTSTKNLGSKKKKKLKTKLSFDFDMAQTQMKREEITLSEHVRNGKGQVRCTFDSRQK